MNWIRNMKQGTILLVGIVITLIPLSVISYYGLTGLDEMNNRVEAQHQLSVQLEDIDELRYLFLLQRVSVYKLLYFLDEKQIGESSKLATQGTTVLEEMKKDGVDPEIISNLTTMRNAYLSATAPTYQNKNYTKKEFVLGSSKTAVPAGNAYTEALDKASKTITARMQNSMDQTSQIKEDNKAKMIFAIIIALLITLSTILLARLFVVRPLRRAFLEIAEASEHLTGSSKELSLNTDTVSQTTIQITSAINNVAVGASDQSRNAVEAANLVNQVSSAIDQVSLSAQNQVNRISEMMTGIGQLTESINRVSESAGVVANVVDSAASVAGRGKDAVDNTVIGMERIKETVLSSAQKIEELGEKSQQIGNIIEVIDDIAEQTNLLALNAAIEAARAGEHGKGFAVVADEVRKLAERSAKATGEIADLIKGIQAETMEAVEAMEKGTTKVEEGSELAVNAGSAIAEIMNSVKEIVSQISQVSESAGQMASASSQVSHAIEQIASISQETSATAEEVASSTAQIVSVVDSIAASSEESAASSEEVSASTQEQSATIHEISSRVQGLSVMADKLEKLVEGFNV
jgi:methyl-accepting chemotaxis protein